MRTKKLEEQKNKKINNNALVKFSKRKINNNTKEDKIKDINTLLNSIDYNNIIQYELNKCKEDIGYFLSQYAYIKHPIDGVIKFDTYEYQDTILDEFQKHKWNLIKKSRQLGISTLISGYIAHQMIFNKAFTAVVIANKASVAKNIIDKIRRIFNKLPAWFLSGLNLKVIAFNKFNINLSNESDVTAMASTEDAGRSIAGSLVVWDEMAFVRTERLTKMIWDSITSVLATGGNFIGLSTPKGVGNLFHKEWIKALNGENGFNPIELNWKMHPDRDWKWRKEQDKKLGKKTAAQECDGDFLAGGGTVIDYEVISWYEENLIKEPIEKRYNNKLHIFENPVIETKYVIACDVSRGDGSDKSSFQVLRMDNYEQCASYDGYIPTTPYSLHIFQVALEYNKAIIIIENNSIGWAVINKILELDYQNIFYSVKGKNIYLMTNPDKILEAYENTEKLVPGFSNNKTSRDLAIDKLQEYFNNKKIKIYDNRTIDELKTFIWKPNGKAEHQSGMHDDLIIPLAFGLLIVNFLKDLDKQGLNYLGDLMNIYSEIQNNYNINDDSNQLNSYKDFIDEEDKRAKSPEEILNNLDNWTQI